MKSKLHYLIFSIIYFTFCSVSAQNVSLYQQYNGRFDFTFVGNSMNLGENNITPGCEDLLLTSSSANVALTTNQIIENVYLYWAGSGTGDLNVTLNAIPITAQRIFSNISVSSGLPYFSAFADVTNQVIATGNGNYTLSDLDISQTLINESGYCDNRTNFSGWAMLIVYKDTNLPINQINVYDGLQSIPNDLNITLNSLNVIDNIGAKIGFIAWEGDSSLAVNETLRINGTILSNPPLNPADNAFNGTNSITGSSTLYDLDLDIYDIQNTVSIGDTSALIQLTSGQDVVLINVVVTKLNSQLPDATIVMNDVIKTCNSKIITVNYTVFNTNGTNPLPVGTPIAIYANGQLVGQTLTTTIIPIGGSETGQITVTIPDTIALDFEIKIVVDDNGFGQGIVTELNENNNSYVQMISMWISPIFNTLEPKTSCNQGLTKGTFNFSDYSSLVLATANDTFIGFYETSSDANSDTNPISNTTNYTASLTPKEIFIRVQNQHCYAVTSFLLTTRNCPPTVYNYVSANNDGANDTFFIEGLRNIFLNYELEIYNRWGRLIWTGNNNTQDWDGFTNKGYKLDAYESPKGTYYYLLNLNDVNYPNPLIGWLYFTK